MVGICTFCLVVFVLVVNEALSGMSLSPDDARIETAVHRVIDFPHFFGERKNFILDSGRH